MVVVNHPPPPAPPIPPGCEYQIASEEVVNGYRVYRCLTAAQYRNYIAEIETQNEADRKWAAERWPILVLIVVGIIFIGAIISYDP